ncbi:hypothetical protein [Natrinema amylolyticum]|uniref:hypothetical protein n=1 Tax=Natrinema amylolyticum TaxID=2878679 RepID=UPI001CFB4659|nr:hypothetical protein [Natrinema amylolyticum]
MNDHPRLRRRAAVGNPMGRTPSAGRWDHAALCRATVRSVRPFDDGAVRESDDRFETDRSSVTDPCERHSAHG